MKIVDKFRISPAKEGSSVPDSSILLTFFDAVMLDLLLIKRCFFFNYQHSTSHFIESHLSMIVSSLSLTLHHFYPLAGKLRLSDDPSNERYEILYKDGDSILLAVVESECNFSDVSGTKLQDFSRFQPLIPELNDDDLLAVQLTIFPNQGICIGFCIHHAACDGFSTMHFIKSWASICKSSCTLPLSPPMLPSFDRTALDFLRGHCLGFMKVRQETKNTSPIPETESESLSSSMFRISLEQLERLKKSVQAKAKLLQKKLPYCSTYMVSVSYAWSCHVKLRKYFDDQKVYFPLIVDWRKRLKPAAPPMYFGNCVYQTFAEMKAGDLIKDEGVMLACEAIGNRIKELDSGIISIIMKGIEDRANMLAGNPIFNVAGSNRFGVYNVDFGWGRPVKVEIVLSKEGYYLAENGDESGSVEIGVVLPKHEMQEFETIFTRGLTSLSQI